MALYTAEFRGGPEIHGVQVMEEVPYATEVKAPSESISDLESTLKGSKASSSLPASDLDNEKGVPEEVTREPGPNDDDDDPALRDIPWHIRRVVSLTDDPTLFTITFRYFILVIIFIVPGAFLAQMDEFRTTSAPYSIFFVQIGANYVGEWLAATLPAWYIRIPLTKMGFSLNPGPFSVKEHVLVTIAAASGATYNLAYTAIASSEIYFGERINAAVAIFFMLAIVWTGYSYAALARQFLIYDPIYPW